MSELQKGIGVIPTIDANGAVWCEAIEGKLKSLVRGCTLLRAKMHPSQAAAIENRSAVVTHIVSMPVDSSSIDLLKRPERTFAGFPMDLSLECPENEILLEFTPEAFTADGVKMGPMIAARIINLELPTYNAQ